MVSALSEFSYTNQNKCFVLHKYGNRDMQAIVLYCMIPAGLQIFTKLTSTLVYFFFLN